MAPHGWRYSDSTKQRRVNLLVRSVQFIKRWPNFRKVIILSTNIIVEFGQLLHSNTMNCIWKVYNMWNELKGHPKSLKIVLLGSTYTATDTVCSNHCVCMPSVLWRCWLGGRKCIWPVKNWVVGCWHGCLGWGADLHITQQIPLPLTISCSSKSRLVLTFLVPAHPGGPGYIPEKQ